MENQLKLLAKDFLESNKFEMPKDINQIRHKAFEYEMLYLIAYVEEYEDYYKELFDEALKYLKKYNCNIEDLVSKIADYEQHRDVLYYLNFEGMSQLLEDFLKHHQD